MAPGMHAAISGVRITTSFIARNSVGHSWSNGRRAVCGVWWCVIIGPIAAFVS